MEGIYEMDIKILLFPISLLLSILTAFLTFLLTIGTTILYLLMLMCVVVGVVSLFQKDFSIGIEALILGFLLSPYGIPMVGAVVIVFLESINERIRSI
ncbi:MAG: CD1845 family protein [Eubacterium sp.]